MTAIRELTQNHFNQICDEFNAPCHRRSRLSKDEVVLLAESLNKKINVPLISEAKEESILIRIILKIDRFMYDNLPNELYDITRSLDRGIDDNEAKRLIVRLTRLANRHIDIPYIPEIMEHIAIRCIIGIIINSVRKHWDLTRSAQSFWDADIPKHENINDHELEELILEPSLC
ncbi:MAG: hypothetical protein N4A49_15040 [Marinifilaceae bacterium]|jgi:hypothetical protein|nr:hypothetical protein [Marinifilaceae bacterium]